MEKTNRSEAVNQFMQNLEHPLKAEIEALREIILDAHPEIRESIKWNAPNFVYQGEDRITLRLFPAMDQVQLVFHRGVKPKDSADFAFADDTGLMKWVAKDRATVTFREMKEVKENAPALQDLVRRWMEA